MAEIDQNKKKYQSWRVYILTYLEALCSGLVAIFYSWHSFILPHEEVTLNSFATLLKDFAQVLSTCWLLFLHFSVQLIPNHWFKLGLWTPGLLKQHFMTFLQQSALTWLRCVFGGPRFLDWLVFLRQWWSFFSVLLCLLPYNEQ